MSRVSVGWVTLDRSAAALLEPGDRPGERRLGDPQRLGRGEDLPRLGDREELHQIFAPVEHVAAPVSRGGGG